MLNSITACDFPMATDRASASRAAELCIPNIQKFLILFARNKIGNERIDSNSNRPNRARIITGLTLTLRLPQACQIAQFVTLSSGFGAQASRNEDLSTFGEIAAPTQFETASSQP